MVFGRRRKQQSNQNEQLSKLMDVSREEDIVRKVPERPSEERRKQQQLKQRQMWKGFRMYKSKKRAQPEPDLTDEEPWDGNFMFDVDYLTGEDGNQSYEISLSFSDTAVDGDAIQLQRSTKSFRGFLMKRGKSFKNRVSPKPFTKSLSRSNKGISSHDKDRNASTRFSLSKKSSSRKGEVFNPFSDDSMESSKNLDVSFSDGRSLPAIVSPSNSTRSDERDGFEVTDNEQHQQRVNTGSDTDTSHVYTIKYTESFRAVPATPDLTSPFTTNFGDEDSGHVVPNVTTSTSSGTHQTLDNSLIEADEANPISPEVVRSSTTLTSGTSLTGPLSNVTSDATSMVSSTVATEDGDVGASSSSTFTDTIRSHPCTESMVHMFKCATSLTHFENMLFDYKNNVVSSLQRCSIADNNSPDVSFISNHNDEDVIFPDIDDEGEEGAVDSFRLVDMFLNQATKTGIPLTFYQPKDNDGDEWDSHEICLYVTPGRRDDRVCVPPMLMWVSKNQPQCRTSCAPIVGASCSSAVIYNHFDLADIDSVLKPDQRDDPEQLQPPLDQEQTNTEMEQVCFSVITKAGDVFLFEASTQRQRDYVVDSLVMVISRLSFV